MSHGAGPDGPAMARIAPPDLWARLVSVINSGARRVPTWILYLLGLAQIPWLFYQGLTGGLGIEPIEALEHRYGLLGLQFLVAGLCITPMRCFLGLNLIRFRRCLGLLAFSFICAHLLVWLLLDVQSAGAAWKDIVKRPYITIGMLGFVLLVPLAATSTDAAILRMGARRWRQLHKLTYFAVIAGSAHFVMLVKGWQAEPILYLGAATCLLLLRVVPKP